VNEANRVQALTIETTILVSTSFLSNLRASRKRPVSTGVSQADLMLFFNGIFNGAGQAAQNIPEPGRGAGIDSIDWG
jgi:hypothetical protein